MILFIHFAPVVSDKHSQMLRTLRSGDVSSRRFGKLPASSGIKLELLAIIIMLRGEAMSFFHLTAMVNVVIQKFKGIHQGRGTVGIVNRSNVMPGAMSEKNVRELPHSAQAGKADDGIAVQLQELPEILRADHLIIRIPFCYFII